ncbi:MAG: hypothetical protein A2144_02205 [Chloroflexi bacterium RBG_16_50_9]|nr:MAG: hypothetical protein A2144_02205 [Chloroflexi bacterium RBG_16_50_9]
MSMHLVNEHSFPQSRFQIQIGNVCCAIICRDCPLNSELQLLFDNFQSHEPADITIELEVVDGISPAQLTESLSRTRISRTGNHFTADDLVLESDFDASARIIYLRVERAFFAPDAEFKLINRLLTKAYYTVCQWKFGGLPPALLVHSSVLVWQGSGLLFTAPSGTGKTTVARLLGSDQNIILNDEMTLVSRRQPVNGAITVRGIPILGDLSQRHNMEVPLRCVFLLKQSMQTATRRLSQMEAYLRFIRQVISPIYLGPTNKQELFSLIAEFSDEVTGMIPFYELEFTLDKHQLWQAVSEVEKSLDKEEIKIG